MGGSKSETHLDAVGGEETDEDSSSVRSKTGSANGDFGGGFFKGVSRGLSKMTSISSFRRRNGSDSASYSGPESSRASTASSAIRGGSVSTLATTTTVPPASPSDSSILQTPSPILPPLPPPSPARENTLPPITPVSAAWSFEEGASEALRMRSPVSTHLAATSPQTPSLSNPISILSHSSDRSEANGDSSPKPPSHNRKPSIKIQAPNNSPLSNFDMPVPASPTATRRSLDTTNANSPSRRSIERGRTPNDHAPLPHPPSFSLPRIPSSPLHLNDEDGMQPQEFMNWLQSQAVVEEKEEVNIVEESDLMASVLAVAKKPVRRAKSFAERHIVITPENMEEFAEGKEASPKEPAGSIASVGRMKGLAPLKRGKKTSSRKRSKGATPSQSQQPEGVENGTETSDSPGTSPTIVADGTGYPPPQPPSPTSTHPSLSRFGSGGRRSSISSAVSRRSSVLSIHGNPLENADLPGAQEMEGGDRAGPLATIMHAEAIVAKAVAETMKEESEEKKEEVEDAKEEGSESEEEEEDEGSVDGSIDVSTSNNVDVGPGSGSTDGLQLPLHPVSPFHNDGFADEMREVMPKQRLVVNDDVPPPPSSTSFIPSHVAPIEPRKSPRLPASPTISTSKLATYVETAPSPTSPKEPPILKGRLGRKGEGKNPWTWLSKILTPKKKTQTDSSASTLADRVLGTRSPAASIERARRSSDSVHDDNWEDNVYPHDSLSSGRYPLHIEKAVYRLSHIKLAQPRRPLHEQVVVSNLMLYILSVHADVTLNRGGPRGRKKKGKKRSRSGKRGRSASQGSIEVSPGRSGRRNQQGYILPDEGSLDAYDQLRRPSGELTRNGGMDAEEGPESNNIGGSFPAGFVGLPAPPPGQDGMPPHPILMYSSSTGGPYPPHFSENGIVTPIPFNAPPIPMYMPPIPNGQQMNGINQINGMNGPAYYPPFDPTFHLQPFGNAFPLPIPQPPQINRNKSQEPPLVSLGETGEGSSTVESGSAPSNTSKDKKDRKRRSAKTSGHGSDSDESVKSAGSVRSNGSARSKTSVRSTASNGSKRGGRGRGAAAAVAAEALQSQIQPGQQHTPVSLFYGNGFGYQQGPGAGSTGVAVGRIQQPEQSQERDDDDEDLVPSMENAEDVKVEAGEAQNEEEGKADAHETGAIDQACGNLQNATENPTTVEASLGDSVLEERSTLELENSPLAEPLKEEKNESAKDLALSSQLHASEEPNMGGLDEHEDELEDFDVEAAIKDELTRLKEQEPDERISQISEFQELEGLDAKPVQITIVESNEVSEPARTSPRAPIFLSEANMKIDSAGSGDSDGSRDILSASRNESLLQDGAGINFVSDISSIDLRSESNLENMSSWNDLMRSVAAKETERASQQAQLEKDVEEFEGVYSSLPQLRSSVVASMSRRSSRPSIGLEMNEDTRSSLPQLRNSVTKTESARPSRPSSGPETRSASKLAAKDDSLDSMISDESFGSLDRLRERLSGAPPTASMLASRNSETSSYNDDFGSDEDEFELPEELRKEKEALDRRLKELDAEQKSQQSLLDALHMEQDHPFAKRPPPPKKKLQKPKIRNALPHGKDDEAVPWHSNGDLGSRETFSRTISLTSSVDGLGDGNKSPVEFRSRRASVDSTTDRTSQDIRPAGATSDGDLLRPRPLSVMGDDHPVDDELAALATQERSLKIELQTFERALKAETEKQSHYQMKLETQQSSINVQRRAVRATKMKVRELEDRCRQVLHWLSVVAKVAFEKEKDKSNALLQKCAKLTAKFKKHQDQCLIRVETIKTKITDGNAEKSSAQKEIEELKITEKKLEQEVELLRAELEEESQLVASKKEMREKELMSKIHAEEAQRQFELSLLRDACTKQRPSKPVDFEDLLIYEAIDKGLQKGIHKLVDLLWLNLSSNPLKIEALGPNDIIQIVEIGDTELEDMSPLDQISNLLYLDAAKTRIGNGGVDHLFTSPLLQYLSLAGNQYSSVPDIPNILLQHLHIQFNSIRRLNILSWLPRLRILRADDNQIENVEPLSMCPCLVELSLANNKIKEMREIYSIACCRKLKRLDMDRNPVSYLREFYSTIYTLFCEVEMLNGAPYSRKLRPKDVPGYRVPGPLKQVGIWKECLKHYLRQNVIQPDERAMLRERWDDYTKIFDQHQFILDSFMGPMYEPYLEYLNGKQGQVYDNVLSKETSLESRIQWFTGLLSQQHLDIVRLGKEFAPSCDLANQAILDEIKFSIDEMNITYVQACWRSHVANRKTAASRNAVIKIQLWIKNKLDIMRRKKNAIQMGAVIKIQKIWRGYRVRKLMKKLRAMMRLDDDDDLGDLDDTSFLDWIDNVQENQFDDGMNQYLKDENLQHFTNINPNVFRRARRPNASRDRPKAANGSHQNEDGEVNLFVLKEDASLHWSTVNQGSMLRHEELPPLGSFDPNLVDFDPLKEYLAQRNQPEPPKQEEKEESDDDWNLQDAKAKSMLARKQARDRAMLHKLHKRDNVRDPLRRLRNFYKSAYRDLLEVTSPESASPKDRMSPKSRRHSKAEAEKLKGKVVYRWDIEAVDPGVLKSYCPPPKLPEIPKARDVPEPVEYKNLKFATDPGVILLINNYVANKVVGNIPRHVDNESILKPNLNRHDILPSIKPT
ncbi:hypothetical protein HDU97_003024 [Phlyctochytrium planicorne]|nr:hypothetical protein HDU97_003024 [Phlyctochytrium planicorne]